MGNAIRGPEVISGCPYQGILKLVREDGETLEMFVASDSCDSVAYEGRIGFEYGRQEELAAIFQEANGDRQLADPSICDPQDKHKDCQGT